MPHGFIPGTPEERHLVREMRRFIDTHTTERPLSVEIHT
jgi:hypothetical protein